MVVLSSSCLEPLTDVFVCLLARSTTCPNCETKFPTCIVTGQPLFDYQFWMCTVCKHRAYEKDITDKVTCPLCHTRIWLANPATHFWVSVGEICESPNAMSGCVLVFKIFSRMHSYVNDMCASSWKILCVIVNVR